MDKKGLIEVIYDEAPIAKINLFGGFDLGMEFVGKADQMRELQSASILPVNFKYLDYPRFNSSLFIKVTFLNAI